MQNRPVSTENATTQGYLIAVTSAVVWSTTAIFIRYLNDEYGMPSLALAFWRDGFVALGLLLLFGIARRTLLQVERRHWGFLLAYGFTLSIFNASWTVSVRLNGAAISTVLVYSSPALTAVISRFLFDERLGKFKIFAIGLSILGTALVSGVLDAAAWDLNPWGILVGLISGIAFAVYSLMGKAASERGINSWTALLHTFWIAALFLLAYNAFPDGSGTAPLERLFWLKDAWFAWGMLIILALGPTIGGYGLYNLSMRYLPAGVANLIVTLEPSLTTLQAYLFLGERLTLAQIGGSLLILVSVVILRLREQYHKRCSA